MQLFHANQSIRNVRDISNATHDRPIPTIGTIFNIILIDVFFKIEHREWVWTVFGVGKMSRYVSWCTAITQPTAAKILSSIDTMMETIYKTNNHQLA
jgi:hypothetical protein